MEQTVLQRPEILAPAGNADMLRAAVFAGADAVYLGLDGYNARRSAGNFDPDALREAVCFCHARGVAVHVTLNTLVYAAELGGLAAAAGAAFCMQNECLKRHRIPGTCRVLPPIRTLEASMKRLVLVAFLLLLLGEWFGWRGHLPINAAKTSIVILLTAGYSVLLWFIYRRGMPGRILACCCVALFIASMSIFLVS